ncbi:MAG TPA: hypothetical protein VK612_03025 [Pyrinomonadaceae bacterium]|nr:hypothetical protein [Pyrinomonadaceae bacterium]
MSQKTCNKCRYEADTDLAKCPQCGSALKSRTTIRVLGGILIVLGGMLIAGMSFLIVWAMNLIASSDKPGISARFNGTKSDMLFMFGVFGLVLVFGLASLVAGLWQLIFGRRNKLLVWVIVGLGVVFILIGTGVQFMY